MGNKTTLIGSAGSIDVLFKMISEYFYTEKLELIPGLDFDGYRLKNHGQAIDGFRIIKKRDRYRFEVELQDGK